MSTVGMVRLKVQLGSYATEHELLVAEHLLKYLLFWEWTSFLSTLLQWFLIRA